MYFAIVAENSTTTEKEGFVATGADITVCPHTVHPRLPYQLDINLKV